VTALTTVTFEAVTLLARVSMAADPDEVPMPNDVKPGWIATVVIGTLFFVTVLLWLNMRKQLGKIHFDEPSDDGPGPSAPRPAAGRADEPMATSQEPPRQEQDGSS
jgi:hypothetical protein